MSAESGPYHLHRCLGVGGQGQVWRAEGPAGDAVAVKLASTPRARAELLAAATLLEQLDHPGIVRRLDHDPHGRWLAMTLIEGQPLHRWAEGRPLAARLETLIGVVEALAFLHDAGVTHGDLKPDNVLIDDTGKPTLIDLSPDIAGGSLGYAAPEQLLGAGVGAPADVYAIGGLGYRMLTDQPPFTASDPAALLWLPVNALPLPPSSVVPGIPAALEGLVMSCLARTPSARPTDLHRLAAELRNSLSGPLTPPVFGMHAARRQLRRHLIAAMGGSSPMVTVLGGSRSGRSTLIEELLDAAEREGLVVHRPPHASAPAALAQLAAAPFALRLEEGDAHTHALCAALQSRRLPGITLLRAEHPPPESSRSICVRTAPLSEADVAEMLSSAGLLPGSAPDIHRMTRGHPGVVRDYIRCRGLPSDLTGAQRSLLDAVSTGPRSLHALARRLGLSEHDLLDLAEPLIGRGLLEARDGGATLLAVRPRSLLQ